MIKKLFEKSLFVGRFKRNRIDPYDVGFATLEPTDTSDYSDSMLFLTIISHFQRTSSFPIMGMTTPFRLTRHPGNGLLLKAVSLQAI
jgi:hypothetical protein